MIELFEYRHKYVVLKNKVPILSVRVPLEDEKLYTEETVTYTSEWKPKRVKISTDCSQMMEMKALLL